MTDSPVRICETDAALSGLTRESFRFGAAPASLALAFVSPYVDFATVAENLQRLAAPTPVLAVSTSGQLCSWEEGTGLYRPSGPASPGLVVQIFSRELIEAISIHTVPLPNEDIRLGAPPLAWEERVQRISHSLGSVEPDFPLSVQKTFALVFLNGVSGCEGEFTEALYASGRFPVLFVGGLAAGELGCQHTYVFDGARPLENHAVITFVKLARGKHYDVLKSHNFVPTGKSLLVIDADPNRRTVALVENGDCGHLISLIDGLCQLMEVPPERLGESLKEYTLGVKIGGEIYLRSILDIDHANGLVSFFSAITPGERLFLLRAEDFLVRTSSDIHSFLQYKSRAITAILCDCIKRRHGDALDQALFSSPWPVPVAGFSTFGEIMGVNLNETLVAIVFFEGEEDRAEDEFVRNFPVIYASFAQTRLYRLQILSQLLIHAATEVDQLVSTGTAIRLPIRDYYGEVGQLHASFRRLVKKLAANEDEMERLATHDSLTGLPNRREVLTRIEQALARAERYGGNFALLFIDLDKFKPINDELGHDAGDAALIEVGARLSAIMRKSDTVARIGGDEFVVLADTLGSDRARAEETASRIAQKCLEEIHRPFLLKGQERKLGMSIGISIADGHSSIHAALSSADTAMYAAKRSSHEHIMCAGRICLASPQNESGSMFERKEPDTLSA